MGADCGKFKHRVHFEKQHENSCFIHALNAYMGYEYVNKHLDVLSTLEREFRSPLVTEKLNELKMAHSQYAFFGAQSAKPTQSESAEVCQSDPGVDEDLLGYLELYSMTSATQFAANFRDNELRELAPFDALFLCQCQVIDRRSALSVRRLRSGLSVSMSSLTELHSTLRVADSLVFVPHRFHHRYTQRRPLEDCSLYSALLHSLQFVLSVCGHFPNAPFLRTLKIREIENDSDNDSKSSFGWFSDLKARVLRDLRKRAEAKRDWQRSLERWLNAVEKESFAVESNRLFFALVSPLRSHAFAARKVNRRSIAQRRKLRSTLKVFTGAMAATALLTLYLARTGRVLHVSRQLSASGSAERSHWWSISGAAFGCWLLTAQFFTAVNVLPLFSLADCWQTLKTTDARDLRDGDWVLLDSQRSGPLVAGDLRTLLSDDQFAAAATCMILPCD